MKGDFPVKISVCQGSGCRMNGADFIHEDLQRLLRKNNLEDTVTLCRRGCGGMCHRGVCVTVDNVKHALSPSDTEYFFLTEVLPRL